MPSQPLPYERDEGGVVRLTLDQPERSVVVLDSALFERIAATLDAIEGEADGYAAGFVLASRGRVFVAGANLEEINSLDDAALDGYLRRGSEIFGRIAAIPVCTVAEIGGAALGGGLELAMHCDVLLGRAPGEGEKAYSIGLPEASLGICPGWGGTNMLPARIEPKEAIMMTAGGAPMTPEKAHELGLLSGLEADPVALQKASTDQAKRPKPRRAGVAPTEPPTISRLELKERIGAAMRALRDELPATDAAQAVVECVGIGLERGWEAALEAERERLIRLRHTDQARERIEAFLSRSSGKR